MREEVGEKEYQSIIQNSPHKPGQRHKSKIIHRTNEYGTLRGGRVNHATKGLTGSHTPDGQVHVKTTGSVMKKSTLGVGLKKKPYTVIIDGL